MYVCMCVISPHALFDWLRDKGHLSAAFLDNPERAHYHSEYFVSWYVCVCIYVCVFICVCVYILFEFNTHRYI